MLRAVLCSSSGGQNCIITASDDTRGCDNTICPPEGEHTTARNT